MDPVRPSSKLDPVITSCGSLQGRKISSDAECLFLMEKNIHLMKEVSPCWNHRTQVSGSVIGSNPGFTTTAKAVPWPLLKATVCSPYDALGQKRALQEHSCVMEGRSVSNPGPTENEKCSVVGFTQSIFMISPS